MDYYDYIRGISFQVYDVLEKNKVKLDEVETIFDKVRSDIQEQSVCKNDTLKEYREIYEKRIKEV